MAPRSSKRAGLRHFIGVVLRVIAGLLLLAIVFVAVVMAAFQTSVFRGWLREEIVAYANTALNGRLSLGSLDGNLYSSLVLRSLAITVDDQPFVEMRRLEVRYDLLKLVTARSLVVGRVRAEGLNVRLEEDERGWNVGRLLPPTTAPPAQSQPAPESAGGLGFPVVLEELTLRDASLAVIRPDSSYAFRNFTLQLSARADATRQRVELKQLSFSMPERDVELKRLTAAVDVGPHGAVAVRGVELRTGESALTGHATVAARDRSYDAQIDIDRLSAQELSRALGSQVIATDVRGIVRAVGPASRVAVDGTRIESAAGQVRASGTVDLAADPLAFDLRATIENLNLAGLLGPPQPPSELNGTLEARGRGTTLEDAAVQLSARLTNSSVRETRLDDVTLTASVAEQTVGFDLAAKTDAGKVQAAGTVDMPAQRYEIRVSTEGFDPGRFLPEGALRANINAKIDVDGEGFSLGTAHAEGRVTVGTSQVQDVRVERLSSGFKLAEQRLEIEDLRLESNVGRGSVSGTLTLAGDTETAAPARGDLRFDFTGLQLEPLARLANTGKLEGTVAVHGEARGALDALDLDATVSADALAREGFAVDALTARLRGTSLGTKDGAADLTMSASSLTTPQGEVRGVTLDASWRQQGAGVSHAEADVRIDQDEARQHSLQLAAVLGPEENRITIEKLETYLGRHRWSATGTPVITQRDDRVTVQDLVLRSDVGEVSVSGDVSTSGPEALEIKVKGLEIGAVSKIFLTEEIGGKLSAELDLAGTAAEPSITGHVSIAPLSVAGIGYRTMDAEFRIADSLGDVRAVIEQEPGRELHLDARAPVRASLSPFSFESSGALAGSLRASAIDIKFVDPLVPSVREIGGFLGADLTLSGTVREPVLRGAITLEQGRARVPATGLLYDPIELKARIDGQEVSVDELRVVSGKGEIKGSGSARIAARATTMDATVRLDEFPLFRDQYGQGAASGRMRFGGSAAAPIIEGEIETNRLVILIPEAIPTSVRPPDPTIRVIGPAAPPAPPAKQPSEGGKAPPPGAYEQASIHVRVNVPRNAWLRRSDANIELRGSITASKEPGGELRLAGDLETVRGWFSFQGKKFSVEEGSVIFTGQGVMPRLDVTAAYRTGEYIVYVKIGGKVSKPSIKLSSDPPLEQADVLSVLLFGQPVDELSQGESKALQERAIGLAGGYLAGALRQSVAGALGLDNLEITPGSEGLSDATVSAGKYVTEDIFITLSHALGAESVEQIKLQYFLTRRWSLEAMADTLGQSGLDLFFQRKY